MRQSKQRLWVSTPGRRPATRGHQIFRLQAGDSFRFASTRPYRFANLLDRETLVVLVNSLGWRFG